LEIAPTLNALWGQPRGSGDCKNVGADHATQIAPTCANHFVSPQRVWGRDDMDRSSRSDRAARHCIEHLVYKTLFSDLPAPLRTSPHLQFIAVPSQLIITHCAKSCATSPWDKVTRKKPGTQISRSTQDLSVDVKIVKIG
jgi:hypothetical protein